MEEDKNLRKKLLELLKGGNAHMDFNEAVADFPTEHINTFPQNLSYTFWHLIEHIRITQWDILEFIKNSNYKYIKWPEDYWPKKEKKANSNDWVKTIKLFNKDLLELEKIVKNPKTDFNKKIPWGEGQDILREILLVADHNAYHIGELGILRQIVGTWSKNHEA